MSDCEWIITKSISVEAWHWHWVCMTHYREPHGVCEKHMMEFMRIRHLNMQEKLL